MAKNEELFNAIIKGKRKDVTALVQADVDAGASVEGILMDSMIPAMREIGDRFSRNEVYVPEMLIAARAMQAGLDIVEPLLADTGHEPIAKVAIGTVKGDLHDIGKNLVAMMLKGAGYEVIDLGVDCDVAKYEEAVNNGTQVLLLSALLTTTMPAMKEITEHFSKTMTSKSSSVARPSRRNTPTKSEPTAMLATPTKRSARSKKYWRNEPDVDSHLLANVDCRAKASWFMKSPMLPSDHQATRQRVLELGRSGKPDALPALIQHLSAPSNDIQRLAASAIGKLAEFGSDAQKAVVALAPLAKQARHPQTQQYAIRALAKQGAAAQEHIHDLRDLVRNPAIRETVRIAAERAVASIELAAKDNEVGVKYRCQRCSFDEVFLERRNFETQVEINKTIEARDGTLVQSRGEKQIAEWLTTHGLAYRYDSKYRIIAEFQIRPDFYLPELDVYIEYWGMDTPQYKMSMYKKQTLYQQEGKRLLSIYPKDLSVLDQLLTTKLRHFGFHP